MIRRIRWQILIAVAAALFIFSLLGSFALSSAATHRPLQGRVYVEGVVGTPEQLNPLAQGPDTSQAERDIAALLFEGLTEVDATGRVQPALAERWTASQDSRVYTFTLRSDRTWHDGAPVTADDVLYTVRGVQNANFPGDPALAVLWRNVLVQKLDEQTIRFELSTPFAPFPSLARLPILPAHLFRTLRPEQWAAAPFSRRPVGTGRWKLQALDAQQALLVPFFEYPGRRTLDNLLLRFYPTADAAVLALRRNEVQGVATLATAGRRAPEAPRRTQRVLAPLGDYTMLAFNLRQPPLDEAQFREALALGINRDLLIANVLDGQGRLLDTPVVSGTWAADPQARLPEFRRSAAQQLLGQLGYVDRNGDGWIEQDGQRLTLPLLIADTGEQIALASEVTRQLRAIGIGVEARRVPAATLQTELAAHNFTLALHSWNNVGADPDAYALWHSSRADGGANYAGLRDSQIDQFLTQARATTSETQRRQLYSQFQRRWAEIIPSLPLYQSVLAYDVNASIEGPPQTPAFLASPADRFSLLDEWKIPARQ
ncbi:MAG TPA: peptide ABC transporter substrate-binding protein [Herpetosiphonaceae bacterium]